MFFTQRDATSPAALVPAQCVAPSRDLSLGNEQLCYTCAYLVALSQGIRERPWQRDVEPWDNRGARVARVVGRVRRNILLVPLQRPGAHDDRAEAGEGARGPGPVGDDSESDPRAHLDR